MDNFVYKIRSKTTGQFSTGGNHPRFTKNGKAWKRIQDLESHLLFIHNSDVFLDYNKEVCEIVVYQTKETFVYEMDDALKLMKAKREMRKTKKKKRVVDLAKQTRYEEYIKLKQEFSPLDCVGIEVKICDMKLGKIK